MPGTGRRRIAVAGELRPSPRLRGAFKVLGLGFGILGFRVQGLGFRVLGFRVQGLGFRVWDFRV